MGMTPKQRYRIRQYLKRIQLQREYKKHLIKRQKIFSWIKPILIVGLCILIFYYVGIL